MLDSGSHARSLVAEAAGVPGRSMNRSPNIDASWRPANRCALLKAAAWSRAVVCIAFFLSFLAIFPAAVGHCQEFPFTLDFEGGNLAGWRATGNAFSNQPTFGDNPTARQRGQPSNHQGNYWIGTFENFRFPERERPGSIQGDKPRGTLSSAPFIIPPGRLSFLVGGGSGFETRVELLAAADTGDVEFREKPVYRASGRNTESMERIEWDLTPVAGRTGRLRIVDQSSDGWGHINVDDFRFSALPAGPDRPPEIVPEPRQVVVPELTGRTSDEAAAILADHELVVGRRHELPGDGLPGTVIKQAPAAGTWVLPGTGVTLGIATSRLVTVPDLTGQTRLAALESIRRAELRPGEEIEKESDRPAGTVIAQKPAAGTLVAVASKVWLVLAVPEKIEVPKVVGMALAEGSALLAESRLAVGRLREVTDEADPSTIIDQRPKPGTTVAAGSAVDLIVSRGPALVEVPNLRDLRLESAGESLRRATLRIGAVSTAESTSVADTVIEQQPAAGSQVAAGSAVDLVLARPALTTVPDLVSHPLPEAVDMLRSAGLTPGKTSQRPAEPPENTVIDQQPVAGSRLPVGSGVDIVIAAALSVVVPDLVGLDQAAIQETLKRVRLVPGTVAYQETAEGAGRVLAQSPAAGEEVKAGSQVDVTIAAATLIVVPNLLGQSREEAYETLVRNGLAVGGAAEQSSAKTAGTVLDQRPGPGNKVPPGSAVDLVVAGQPAVALRWAYIAAGLLAVFAAGYFLARRRKPGLPGKDGAGPVVSVRPHVDPGSQEMFFEAPAAAEYVLQLRPKGDPGAQKVDCETELTNDGGQGV